MVPCMLDYDRGGHVNHFITKGWHKATNKVSN